MNCLTFKCSNPKCGCIIPKGKNIYFVENNWDYDFKVNVPFCSESCAKEILLEEAEKLRKKAAYIEKSEIKKELV